MSKSLQDQLLGAGLIDKKKAKQLTNSAKKEKHVKRKSGDDLTSDAQRNAKQAAQEKQQRDRELNAKRKAEADKKAIYSQVLQLVEHYKIKNRQGDIEFNFTDGAIIKKMRLEQLVFEKVSRGLLSVVLVEQRYELLPRPIAEKIRERMPELIVVDNYGKNQDEETRSDDDDYYAQFAIPDDLMW